MRILILKFKTIGDVLLITPLLQNLKLQYPDSLIDVAVNIGTEVMLSLNPDINNIQIYNRSKNRGVSIFKYIYKEYQFIKNVYNKKYDVVIDLDQGDRGAIIAKCSGAVVKIGSKTIKSKMIRNTYTHFLPDREKRHIVEIGLDPLRSLNISIIKKKVRIFWSDKDEYLVNKHLSKVNNFSLAIHRIIHVHPFSRGPHKEIDAVLMAKIIDFCEMELNAKVVLTAAPEKAELNKVYNIVKLCKSNPINLSGELSLKQTAALNKKAKLFIGVDTAIMHISAANDTPVLAFFGPTSPDTWGPWDNDLDCATYHRRGGLQINGKHHVLSTTKHCLPCNNHGCDDANISDCLMHLDDSTVKQNIIDMLSL